MNRIRDMLTGPTAMHGAVTRRGLLVAGSAATGLTLAWALWPRSYSPNLVAAAGETVLNAFLKIGRDGHVTVAVPQCEMGQGVTTLLPQIVADELGADWRTIAVEPAPINPLYANRLLIDEDSAAVTPRALLPGIAESARSWVRGEYATRDAVMITAGSSSVRAFETAFRDAAAQARALLSMAAGARWDVDWQEVTVEGGFALYDGKKLRLGDLAPEAATFDPPELPQYRAQSAEPLYGQELVRLDLSSKVDGSANFAGDIRLPGMVYAAIRQGPHGDTRLTATDKRKALGIRGMLEVVVHDRWVAAIARNWWAANRALDRLAPNFETIGAPVSSDAIEASLAAALKGGEGMRIDSRGDIAEAFAGRNLVHAEYWAAPAQHAPMETRTATAEPTARGMRVWVATQAPAQCREAIATALGMSTSEVTLIPIMAGGSFGIALEHAAAVQAAIIARTIAKPVQLVWSRAEEIMRDLPRPPARARLTASLNVAGTIDALSVKIATPAASHEIRDRVMNGTRPHAARTAALGKSDAGALSGAVPPYTIPNFALDHLPADSGLPAGRWRGNGDSFAAFFNECFVDEMAAKAGIDPLSYRMAMLGGQPELARCLTTATTIGGWEGGISGSGQGLACHSMRGSHIALLATAQPSESGLKVKSLVAVVDCGRIVNPAIARQQIEGGLIFGLAAAVGATTDYKNGVATARRLGQLNLPRLSQCPEISVEFLDSDREPGGLGELAVPVVAPAIANALYAAAGRRIRRLPLTNRPL